MFDLTKYSHSIGQNAYHLIFRCKYNLKCFKRDLIRRTVEEYLYAAAERYGIKVYTLKVLTDHVHMFIEIKPTVSIVQATKLIKGYTAKKFFERFTIWREIMHYGHKKPHLWSRWRFSRTVGSIRADVIEHYINDSHHDNVRINAH